MGEKYDSLNQKGKKVINRVEEKFCFQGDKTYCTTPFFWTDTGFGLYVKTCEETIFDFREDCIAVTLPEKADVIAFSGTPQEIIREYMGLFGPAVLPPETGDARRVPIRWKRRGMKMALRWSATQTPGLARRSPLRWRRITASG